VTAVLAPGSRLGPYEILDAIGAGGMGEVYRARDPRLDRIVAIKSWPPRWLLPGDAFGAPLGLALFSLLTDRIDEAVLWTEKAIAQRQPAVLFFLTVHADTFRQSSHWQRIERLLRL
jgi:hypothetical protein